MALSRRVQVLLWSSFGLLLGLAGVVILGGRHSLLQSLLQHNLPLVNGTQLWPNWLHFPVPIITSIYFFNVTNAHDVEMKGARPQLVEVGPYVYREYHTKVKIVYHAHNDTQTYQQVRQWQWDAELSHADLSPNDYLITLNPVAATVNGLAGQTNKFVRGLANLALKGMKEQLFVEKSVRELTFDGFEDPVLNDAKLLPPFVVPDLVDRFGYFYPRNNSDWFDGVFNMYTGKANLSRLGEITSWNGTQRAFFPGECGAVRGAGDFFPPGLQGHDDYIELYSNDLCRRLVLNYGHDGDQANYHGIPTRHYHLAPSFFANKTENPDNSCFEVKHGEHPSGVYDASACRFGAPIFLSQPHFYQADPFYIQQMAPGSLKPQRAKHETVMKVSPLTGLPMEVKARFQVNFFLQRLSEIDLFKHLPSKSNMFPTVWFETAVHAPDNMLTGLWFLTHFDDLAVVLACVFIGCMFVTFGLLFVCSFSQSQMQVQTHVPLAEDEEEDEPTRDNTQLVATPN